MTTITQSTALWFASRATGVVSLLLLSLVVILGVVVNRHGRLPGLPAFAVTGLHRSLSLLSLAFITVHVITAIADPYVSIRLAAALIPFTSAYEPFWLGLGAVALDAVIALIVTSLVRAHVGRRLWRAIHWLAYMAWPVAFIHGIGASPDLRSGGLRDLAIACALAVGSAVLWRVAHLPQDVPRAERAAAALASIHGPGRRDGSTARGPIHDGPARGTPAAGMHPHARDTHYMNGGQR